MEEHTKANLIVTKSMVTASTNGMMGAFTKGSGKTVSNMVKDILHNPKAPN